MSRFMKGAAGVALTSLLAACNGGSQQTTIPRAGLGVQSVAQLAALDASSRQSALVAGSPYVRALPDGTVLHVAPLPAARAAYAAANKAPDRVEYHNGSIVKLSTLYAIYWQPTGTYMSPKYQPVINEYFKDVGATPQYRILTQYKDMQSNILNASRFGGSWTDTSPYPSDFNHGGTGDADLHTEVLKAIAANGWPNGGIGPIFVIFTASQSPADGWAACAYHASFGSDQANPYVYSIVPYQHDFGPKGCGTPSTTWPNDRDADQTIDTLWHEQAEATSDPNTSGVANTGGWYSNKSGAEIGDLCETSYGTLRPDGSDTTLHDHNYVTQEMWSNRGLTCLQTATPR